jgi:hypothetical protein
MGKELSGSALRLDGLSGGSVAAHPVGTKEKQKKTVINRRQIFFNITPP